MFLAHEFQRHKISYERLGVVIAASETCLGIMGKLFNLSSSHPISKTDKEICPELQYPYQEKDQCRIRQLQILKTIPLWDKLMKSQTFKENGLSMCLMTMIFTSTTWLVLISDSFIVVDGIHSSLLCESHILYLRQYLVFCVYVHCSMLFSEHIHAFENDRSMSCLMLLDLVNIPWEVVNTA